MELRNKNILLISPESWNHIFVSKHHYAVHLSRRNNVVYFLNPPTRTNKIDVTDFENVFSVSYSGFPKGLRFYPSFLQRYLIRKKFNNLQVLCNTKFDIIWSFDTSVFFDFAALPQEVLKISHVVDLNQDFQFKRTSITSTLNLCSTRFILDKQLLYNTRSYFIHHGFVLPTSSPRFLEQRQLAGKIKVGYAGNLNIPYLDWDLLSTLIDIEKDRCEFFFAGILNDPDRMVWMQSSNAIKYSGVLSTLELHSFYNEMDILLICYRADDFPEQLGNPHKMMEYLGSGKTVVATYTAEFEDQAEQGLIAMSRKNDEFCALFDEVVNSIEFWNGAEKRAKRISYANDNSYSNQILRIEHIINAVWKQ